MSTIVHDPSLYVWEKPVTTCTATTVSRLAFICVPAICAAPALAWATKRLSYAGAILAEQ